MSEVTLEKLQALARTLEKNRVPTISIDGEDKFIMLKCPECETVVNINEDQFYGKASIECECGLFRVTDTGEVET